MWSLASRIISSPPGGGWRTRERAGQLLAARRPEPRGGGRARRSCSPLPRQRSSGDLRPACLRQSQAAQQAHVCASICFFIISISFTCLPVPPHSGLCVRISARLSIKRRQHFGAVSLSLGLVARRTGSRSWPIGRSSCSACVRARLSCSVVRCTRTRFRLSIIL